MNRSTVTRWKLEQAEPKNLEELVKIADALNVTTDELLGRTLPSGQSADQLIRRLPPDLQEEIFKKINKILEDYQRA